MSAFMESARLMIDPPQSGQHNMAVDHALLETASRSGTISLRFYRWSEPTLSLGYFQSIKGRQRHAPSQNCPLVRRATGGGAILHHHELTYSLAIPSASRWATRNEQLYSQVHQIIIDLLEERGIVATLYGEHAEPLPSEGKGNRAFLCFQRRTSGDIVMQGEKSEKELGGGEEAGSLEREESPVSATSSPLPFKICGSAQRRRKNALLQHGSLLLARSPYAPELPGIHDLSSVPFDELGFVEAWVERLGTELEVAFVTQGLSEREVSLAAEAMTHQFGHDDWNAKR